MSLVPVDEALARLLDGVERVELEQVPLPEAFGRILGGSVTARRTHPPFDASAMDGYAVRAADIASVPAELNIIGESAAGRRFDGRVEAGQAVRIFTGAPVPNGADTILIQENAQRSGDLVTAIETVAEGRHIRRAGLDFEEGEQLLGPGRRIDPAALALIAAADLTEIAVVRRPRIGIIATGDELVEPGSTRADDQIVASNNFGVAGIVREAGGEAIDFGIAPDDEAAIGAMLEKATEAGCDIVVTLGGASVGDHDLTTKVFADRSVDLAFWKIAMRPGKPLMAGRRGNTHFLGLPGNPVSAMVCAHLFLRPLIARMLGVSEATHIQRATLGASMAENDHRQDYVRAIAHASPGGTVVKPLSIQDSSMLKSLATANALIVRPPNAPAASAGDVCDVVVLRPFI
ncbi:molybdopterin molybdotransferase MoeA [Aliihoeflea sp. PC F10.4]